MPKLFSPLEVGNLKLANRIVIAPMCQYSAEDGCMTDWHTIHLGHLALSGAALLTIEATAVTPAGRISAADLGLWSDANEAALVKGFLSYIVSDAGQQAGAAQAGSAPLDSETAAKAGDIVGAIAAK